MALILNPPFYDASANVSSTAWVDVVAPVPFGVLRTSFLADFLGLFLAGAFFTTEGFASFFAMAIVLRRGNASTTGSGEGCGSYLAVPPIQPMSLGLIEAPRHIPEKMKIDIANEIFTICSRESKRINIRVSFLP
jgi:hypothetical protein